MNQAITAMAAGIERFGSMSSSTNRARSSGRTMISFGTSNGSTSRKTYMGELSWRLKVLRSSLE